MRTIALRQFGSIEHFCELEQPTPAPGPGSVRIRIAAAGFNPVDYKMRRGNFGGTPPLILGRDVAGTVDAVGQGVASVQVGDEVWALLALPHDGSGAYAEYVCVPAEFVAPRPPNVSVADAAGLPVAVLTAWQCLAPCALAPGAAVLVTGASGGVGSYLVQMLRSQGVGPIVATAGSDRSATYIEHALGVPARHILRYTGRTPDALAEQARDLTGGGVHAAFDLVGGSSKATCIEALRHGGQMVTIVEEHADPGFNAWAPTPQSLFFKAAVARFVFLLSRALTAPRNEWPAYRHEMEQVNRLLADGVIRPAKTTVLGPLSVDTVQQAHTLLEEGHVQGKLVMTVP